MFLPKYKIILTVFQIGTSRQPYPLVRSSAVVPGGVEQCRNAVLVISSATGPNSIRVEGILFRSKRPWQIPPMRQVIANPMAPMDRM
ncbi:hypothetical protein D3C86_1604650 [compost metagenome]